MDTRKILRSFVAHESRHIKKPVTAFSDDYDWIIYNSGLVYLPLQVEIPHQIIAEEISNIDHLFVLHRTYPEDHVGWYGFCIHGESYDATMVNQGNLIWTPEALELMPKTVEFFKNQWFGNQFFRLRVMKLAPGGYINRHFDTQPPGKLAAVNIAITNPKGNTFVMEKHGVVPFEPGRAIMLNVSNYHAVLNDSNEPRYHIIAHHAETTDEFKKMVVKSYQKLVQNTN